jgi:hypothetical protein
MLIKDDLDMPLSHPKAHKRHKRSDSFHQKQIRFFSILLGLAAILLVAVLMWLLSRSPASPPLIHFPTVDPLS